MVLLGLTNVTNAVAVARTIQVVHDSLLLVVKHGMLFKATTLKIDTSSI